MWVGQRVRLRSIEPDDWAAFAVFDQYVDDMRSADHVHVPRSVAQYQEWTREESERVYGGDRFRLAIESHADKTLVGSIIVMDADPRAGRFSYGIGIGREHQRKGYAREAILIVLRYMFDERRFHKCGAEAYDYNAASIALHLSLGFREEGRRREHEFLEGAYRDLVLFGMTAGEFRARYG
jgi:RimJ/RimL family protein N-acetyltransferase